MKVIQFDGELGFLVIEELRKAVSERQDIEFHIDSPGGSAELKDQALSLLNELHAAGLHSTGIVKGKASSAAFIVLQACTVRKAFPEATLMFHPRQVLAPPGVYVMGGELHVDSDAPDYLEFLTMLSTRSGVPEDMLSFWGTEERVFTAREGLEYRFIDEIVRPWTPALGQQVARRITEILERDARED